jgi:hypothetical protein
MFFGSTAPLAFFRPDRLFHSRRAQGRSRLAALCAATARLGLDRPEHGGMLDRIGSGLQSPRWLVRLEMTGAGDYCCRARATSRRRATRRLEALPDSLIYALPI